MVHEENGNLVNSQKVNCMSCMIRPLLHQPSMIWYGMGKASVLKLNDQHSMDLPFLLRRSSHHSTRVKDVTIIVDDWLDVFTINIDRFTTTSSEEALLDNGTMSFQSRSAKKSLMSLKRLAMFRGI